MFHHHRSLSLRIKTQHQMLYAPHQNHTQCPITRCQSRTTQCSTKYTSHQNATCMLHTLFSTIRSQPHSNTATISTTLQKNHTPTPPATIHFESQPLPSETHNLAPRLSIQDHNTIQPPHITIVNHDCQSRIEYLKTRP